ncbi:bacterial transcriptional activator domain-containing protein [Alkaliphilus peptidifermentans]|uniref:DNA-binding transcriptional activator of the SARP family n=1 Tax=Alkaliphilus peptidifermentans DSM 18978 TaxID=1120976 RepID=A0A1G5F5I3_9FIRM|nr:bacterial transcriptional activator domain-containing protein [Alkaliphilus peptidifermentans]SCY34526.1 DNA-binding transcriptional activator of the SARP family [Alkaliphilus peptidifermentans DSM 18978]
MKLGIKTLGAFDITYNDESLMKENGIAYKLNKLLMYFITFRGRKLLPETIIDNLLSDIEYNDPKNVLRTQIFRLRQSLKKLLPEELEGESTFNITFNNGYYCLELDNRAVIDADEFTSLINLAVSESNISIDDRIQLYKKALGLYRGSFLSENSYEVWLVPIRNHYRRLYLNVFSKLIELLKEREENILIMELCEEAILIEPFEEALHIYLIEAMLKAGQVKAALSHYEYISSLIRNEMGIKSSPGLRNIYRKIQSYYEEKSEGSIKNIIVKLEESTLDGAVLCDSDYFKFLYNIERRKCLRGEKNEFVSLITLKHMNSKERNKEELYKSTSSMAKVLERSLRKGDIFCFWNDTQVLIMLHEAKEESLPIIKNRIIKNYNYLVKANICSINIEFFSITSDNNIV